jgi:hypothetical protein
MITARSAAVLLPPITGVSPGSQSPSETTLPTPWCRRAAPPPGMTSLPPGTAAGRSTWPPSEGFQDVRYS